MNTFTFTHRTRDTGERVFAVLVGRSLPAMADNPCAKAALDVLVAQVTYTNNGWDSITVLEWDGDKAVESPTTLDALYEKFIYTTPRAKELVALAAKVKRAGYGEVELTPTDFATLHVKRLPKTYLPLERKMRVKISDWERICSYLYEFLTRTPVPHCMLRGHGFRSQWYGELVAKAILEMAERAG